MNWVRIMAVFVLSAATPTIVCAAIEFQDWEVRGGPAAATKSNVPQGAQLRMRVDQVGKGELRVFLLSLQDKHFKDAYPNGWHRPGFQAPIPLRAWNCSDRAIYEPGRSYEKLTEGQLITCSPNSGGCALAILAGAVTKLEKTEDGLCRITTESGYVLSVRVRLEEP